ncbi:PREDICTED: uncharacterized protein LOC105964599 [Erythranthe guttata]|uniref:uncharacterized protein LOC105964599 n=1 Tax=Erythranthe guttata TaxID=4155 RepID=UPI00064D7FCC|nr:PREDICTED: uncharacterized protein LOC105964599 [Erythranthe guttata]|eukprot:XP_012844561.1 PREDICTED: uncharacterized protein LOC105964599 [Erythranthe guttata]
MKVDLYGFTDATYCKIFQTTMTGQAQGWFIKLPGGTIDGCAQLVKQFLSQYSINKKYEKTGIYLFKVLQREGETLRDYVQLFLYAVHEVHYVNHGLLAGILMKNLRHVHFQESLADHPPSTLDELLSRGEKYIRIEKAAEMGLYMKWKRDEDRHFHHNRDGDRHNPGRRDKR